MLLRIFFSLFLPFSFLILIFPPNLYLKPSPWFFPASFSLFPTHLVGPDLASPTCPFLTHQLFPMTSSSSSLDVHTPTSFQKSYAPGLLHILLPVGRGSMAVVFIASGWKSAQFSGSRGELRNWPWKQNSFLHRKERGGYGGQNSKMFPKIPTSWGTHPALCPGLWTC